jgi:tripartite-type tricarboxylate transporter receptor subunit TctC
MRPSWLLLAAACVSATVYAQEQAYPNRPIRLIVTSAAGGSSDTIARTMASAAESHLGRNVVVDNRPGAAGIIGYETVARAAPDGYTLLHGTAALVINPNVYAKLPYSLKDFSAISNLGLGQGYLVVVNPSVPARSVKELIAVARDENKRLAFGSSGFGNSLHLAGEMFNARAGTRLLHVPYKGVGPAMNALMSGEIQVLFVPPTVTVQHVSSGKVRAIGFTGPKRWPGLPEVPTVAEAALPGFDISGSWHAWFAPARTPAAIVNRLYAAVRHALAMPKVQDFLRGSGYEPDGRSPADTRAFMAAEAKRYAEVVRAAGLKPQ